jgi:hypothetical protein
MSDVAEIRNQMWKWLASWGTVARAKAPDDMALTERRSTPVAGKYVLLQKYLEQRYADVTVLTFGQIEDVLGFTLPQLARTYHAWWTQGATNVEGPQHSDAWILAGRTATPNLQAGTVVFERTQPAKAASTSP